MKFAFLCFIALLFGICNETMANTAINRTPQNTDMVTEKSVETTLKSGMFVETVQNFDTVDENVTKTTRDDFTDNGNLLNVTLSEYDNSTDETDNEVDEIHSNFNLAIIPAVAVFVFIVISCIKCCKWFRQYTRGGNKDENYYAVIVTDEDKDYGQVDMLSESASTAYYDTVSSYTSFLKRSGNESTLNSIRTLRLDGSKYDHNVPSQPNNGSVNRVPRTDVTKKSATDTDIKSLNSCSSKKKDVAHGTSDIRTSSTSSADTVSEQLTDSPLIRRNNRFRVSFVTEKPTSKPLTLENKVTHNSNAKLDKVIRSNLKKTPTKDVRLQDVTPQNYSTNKANERVTMVDVGTQTNKSFRYSLRKSKGHVSDSDIDERLLAKLNFMKDGGDNLHQSVVIRNTDRHAHTVLHARHSSLSQEEQHCEPLVSNIISEISKYPLDTNVEVINNRKTAQDLDEEFEDDVFMKEDEKGTNTYSNTEKQTFIKELPETNCKENSRGRESVNENVSVNSVYICADCNPKTEKLIQPFCDKSPSNVAKNEKVVPKYCKNCQILRKGKPRDSDDKVNTDLADVHIKEQCKFTLGDPPECDERRASSLSLESSGYAELSSTGSSTSTQ